MSMDGSFQIKWDGARYTVSIPNYLGGDVIAIEHYLALQAERDRLKAELVEAKRQTWKDAAQAYTRYRQALIPQAGDWRKPEPFDEWCLRQAHGDIQP